MVRMTRRFPATLLIWGGVLTLLTIATDRAGLLEVPENWFYDARARHCQYFAPPPSPDIVHLDIDDASLGAAGRWPWPRAVIADMMDEIHLAGPKAVLLDILFVDPAEPEWKRETAADGTTHFVKIDHDALLAASFQRMGNAIVPTELNFQEPPPTLPLELQMRVVLEKNLEYSDEQVAKLAPAGVSNEVWLGAFLTARRYVAQQRVSQAWDRINPADAVDASDLDESPPQPAGASGPTAPSTRPGETQSASPPSTSPVEATQPVQVPATGSSPVPTTQATALADLQMSLPQAGPLERQIIVELLPHSDLSTNSTQLRAVDEAFQHVRAERALRHLSFPVPPSLPNLFRPSEVLLPVPVLSRAAAATAFVDYPPSRDGKIRSVPLMLEYEGRMYPQVGLMLASMMLGVSPRDFHYSPDTITIPMAGRPDGKGGVWRRDIRIPIRTYYSSQLKQPVPTYFDIPWYGGREWEAMYDQAHPRPKSSIFP